MDGWHSRNTIPSKYRRIYPEQIFNYLFQEKTSFYSIIQPLKQHFVYHISMWLTNTEASHLNSNIIYFEFRYIFIAQNRTYSSAIRMITKFWKPFLVVKRIVFKWKSIHTRKYIDLLRKMEDWTIGKWFGRGKSRKLDSNMTLVQLHSKHALVINIPVTEAYWNAIN